MDFITALALLQSGVFVEDNKLARSVSGVNVGKLLFNALHLKGSAELEVYRAIWF